jgi:hypothetical protein
LSCFSFGGYIEQDKLNTRLGDSEVRRYHVD